MSFDHNLSIPDGHYLKLLKGKIVQLKHDHIQPGGKKLAVLKENNTKILKALRNKRGVRVKLNSDELTLNGGSLTSKLDAVGSKILKTLKAVNKTGALKPLLSVGLASAGADPISTTLIADAGTKMLGKGVLQQSDKVKLAKAINKKEIELDNIKEGHGLLMSSRSMGNGLMLSSKSVGNGLYNSTKSIPEGKGLLMTSGRGKSKKTIYI